MIQVLSVNVVEKCRVKSRINLKSIQTFLSNSIKKVSPNFKEKLIEVAKNFLNPINDGRFFPRKPQ